MSEAATTALMVLLGGTLYLLPAIIGANKKNFAAILALNILLGWTVIGWIIALIWALTHEQKAKGDEELKEPSKDGGLDAT